jgi:hypothetical protein
LDCAHDCTNGGTDDLTPSRFLRGRIGVNAFRSDKRRYLLANLAAGHRTECSTGGIVGVRGTLRRNGSGEHDQQCATRPEFVHSTFPVKELYGWRTLRLS